ncbi:MAG: hypothetical protein K2X12_02655 [Burkholderiaceae bacterium]|jgi:hypothetical protein|nr:hypothetical protein [Burkholderiaceae bacterium]
MAAYQSIAAWVARCAQALRFKSRKSADSAFDEAFEQFEEEATKNDVATAILAANQAGRAIPPAVDDLSALLSLNPAARATLPHLVAVESTLRARPADGFDYLPESLLERAIDQLERLIDLRRAGPLSHLHLQMQRALSEKTARRQVQERREKPPVFVPLLPEESTPDVVANPLDFADTERDWQALDFADTEVLGE